MKLAVLACLLIALCGCAPKPHVIANSSQFAAAGSAFDGRATVYVMRDLSGVGIKWPVHVELDGIQKGVLHRESYARFAVSTGRHVIIAHWNHALNVTPDVAISSDFEAGRTYYFSIGTSTGMGGGGILFGARLAPLEPSIGVELAHKYEDRTSSVDE